MYAEWVLEVMGQKVKEEVGEKVEVIILGVDEDDEGVGREAQQGSEVHPSGGTDFSLAEAASTLDIQNAISMLSESPRVGHSPPIPP